MNGLPKPLDLLGVSAADTTPRPYNSLVEWQAAAVPKLLAWIKSSPDQSVQGLTLQSVCVNYGLPLQLAESIANQPGPGPAAGPDSLIGAPDVAARTDFERAASVPLASALHDQNECELQLLQKLLVPLLEHKPVSKRAFASSPIRTVVESTGLPYPFNCRKFLLQYLWQHQYNLAALAGRAYWWHAFWSRHFWMQSVYSQYAVSEYWGAPAAFDQIGSHQVWI
jgi:hypothetical protein